MKLILDGFYEIDISEDEDLDEEMAKEILVLAQYFQAPFFKENATNFLIEKFYKFQFPPLWFSPRKWTEILSFADNFQLEDLTKMIEKKLNE